jgi:hypothetical protein
MRKSHSEHFSTAVPQRADIARRGQHGRKVPIPAVSTCSKFESLFDHLVGDGEQRGPRVTISNGLRLRDLFENATFGLDTNCDKGDGRDQIDQRFGPDRRDLRG